jgi:hypothetical protein
MTATSEYLCIALNDRWHYVKHRHRGQMSSEVFQPRYTPNPSIARAKVAEQLRIIAAAGGSVHGSRKDGLPLRAATHLASPNPASLTRNSAVQSCPHIAPAKRRQR